MISCMFESGKEVPDLKIWKRREHIGTRVPMQKERVISLSRFRSV